MTIANENGKFTCTTVNGEAVSRNSTAGYTAAIVGRNAKGKLCIVYASACERAVREMFAKIPHATVGSEVYCKFARYTELELCTA